jgi:hypothetical protein
MTKGDGSDPWGDPQFEQAVRETAYFLWEQDGRPFGREQDYWYRALERTLRERNSDAGLRERPDDQANLVGDERQIDDNQDDLGRPYPNGHT